MAFISLWLPSTSIFRDDIPLTLVLRAYDMSASTRTALSPRDEDHDANSTVIASLEELDLLARRRRPHPSKTTTCFLIPSSWRFCGGTIEEEGEHEQDEHGSKAAVSSSTKVNDLYSKIDQVLWSSSKENNKHDDVVEPLIRTSSSSSSESSVEDSPCTREEVGGGALVEFHKIRGNASQALMRLAQMLFSLVFMDAVLRRNNLQKKRAKEHHGAIVVNEEENDDTIMEPIPEM